MRAHQLLLESCLKEYVFLLVHYSWLRASAMRDLAQPIAPSALSAFRAIGLGRRFAPSSDGAALRAAVGVQAQTLEDQLQILET